MFRLAYRNFGDHESVVGNYTVTLRRGVRWFELRNVTSGPVTVYHKRITTDTTWRWMGSAMLPLVLALQARVLSRSFVMPDDWQQIRSTPWLRAKPIF